MVGRESAESTLRMLAGYPCFADRVTGSKQVRADPFAAQVQAGNVRSIAGPWVKAFLEEAEYSRTRATKIRSTRQQAPSTG